MRFLVAQTHGTHDSAGGRRGASRMAGPGTRRAGAAFSAAAPKTREEPALAVARPHAGSGECGARRQAAARRGRLAATGPGLAGPPFWRGKRRHRSAARRTLRQPPCQGDMQQRGRRGKARGTPRRLSRSGRAVLASWSPEASARSTLRASPHRSTPRGPPPRRTVRRTGCASARAGSSGLLQLCPLVRPLRRMTW